MKKANPSTLIIVLKLWYTFIFFQITKKRFSFNCKQVRLFIDFYFVKQNVRLLKNPIKVLNLRNSFLFIKLYFYLFKKLFELKENAPFKLKLPNFFKFNEELNISHFYFIETNKIDIEKGSFITNPLNHSIAEFL